MIFKGATSANVEASRTLLHDATDCIAATGLRRQSMRRRIVEMSLRAILLGCLLSGIVFSALPIPSAQAQELPRTQEVEPEFHESARKTWRTNHWNREHRYTCPNRATGARETWATWIWDEIPRGLYELQVFIPPHEATAVVQYTVGGDTFPDSAGSYRSYGGTRRLNQAESANEWARIAKVDFPGGSIRLELGNDGSSKSGWRDWCGWGGHHSIGAASARLVARDCLVPLSLDYCKRAWNSVVPKALDDPFDLYKGPSDYALSKGNIPIDKIDAKLVEPTINAGNFNGKTSYSYSTSRVRGTWPGQKHHYACGVKNAYSTFASYNFGKVSREGDYAVYAYYPGPGDQSGNLSIERERKEDRNDGHGIFSIFVNGQHQRSYKQEEQFGGWRRIKLSEADSRHDPLRFLRKLRSDDSLSINVDNGLHRRQGNCADGTRVVFPPLLLVNHSHYKLDGFVPFDPNRHVNPIALSLFAACMATPADGHIPSHLAKSTVFIHMLEAVVGALSGGNASLSQPIPGVAGGAGFSLSEAVSAYANWKHANALALRCEEYQSEWCPDIPHVLVGGPSDQPDSALMWSGSQSSRELESAQLQHPLGADLHREDRLRGPVGPGYDYYYNDQLHRFSGNPWACAAVDRSPLHRDSHDIFEDNGIIWVRHSWN